MSERPGGEDLINLRTMTSEQFALLNENIPTTPNSFRHSGTAAPMTLKEQEKLMDEIKKENFDLKLRVYHLEDRLRQMAPSNVDQALKENVELKVQNEALLAEIKSHQEIINEAQAAIEQYRQQNAARPATEAEIGRLKQELELTATQLGKTQSLCQKYEGQLALFDKESRETVQTMRQNEIEIGSLNKRLAESQHTIEKLEEEIKGLEEELGQKNGLIHQFKLDSQGMAQDLEMITRQMTDLQNNLRAVQDERDQLLKERETIRRASVAAAPQPPNSPRSSLDLLESKLMRELTQATKRLQDLEKQTELTQSEKEQLLNQSKSLHVGIEQATAAIKHLGQKLCTPSNTVLTFGPSASFPEVFEQVEKVADHLIRDYDEHKHAKAVMTEALKSQEQLTAVTQAERQRLELELGHAQQRLDDLQSTLMLREDELRRIQEAAESFQRKASEAYDAEMPRLREEIAHLRSELARFQAELESNQAELHRAQMAAQEFRDKWEEAQSIAIQSSSESSDRLAQIAQLQQSRAELVKKLATSEEMAQSLNRKVEDMKNQLDHAERVKLAVEEGFNRQLKSLHASNTELKLQLAANSSGASDANARLERLNSAMESLRMEKDGLFNKLQVKEHSIGALQQELESLKMERKRMETDLSLREEQLRKLEMELNRLRKDDLNLRKNADGLNHLQSKVESLSALNTFLREQSEQKEKHIKDLEERLRRQSDEMRVAMSEVDAQTRKLKKREQLITQALKRLETINSLTLPSDLTSALNPAPPLTSTNYSSSLGTHHLGAPADDLTPIRPTKLPFTTGGSTRPAPTKSDKENDYLRNFEF